MTEPSLMQRQRSLLRDLARLLSERRAAAVDSEADFQARNKAAEQEFQEARQRVAARAEADAAAAQREHEQARQAINTHFESDQVAARKEYTAACEVIEARHASDSDRAARSRDDARYSLTATFEAKRREVETPFEEVGRKVAEGLLRVRAMRDEVSAVVAKWRHGGRYTRYQPEARQVDPSVESLREMKRYLGAAEESLESLKRLRIARFFQGKRPFVLLLFLLLAFNGGLFAVEFFELAPLRGLPWWAVGTGAAVLLDIALSGLLYAWGRVSILSRFRPLARRLAETEAAAERAREFAQTTYKKKMADIAREEKDTEDRQKNVDDKYNKLMATIEQRRDQEKAAAKDKNAKQMAEQVQQRDNGLRMAEEQYKRRLAAVKQRAESDLKAVDEKRRKTLDESHQKHEKGWHAQVRAWQQAIAKAQAVAKEVNAESFQLCPEFGGPAWKDWVAPKATPPVLRFGTYAVSTETLAEGTSDGPWKVPDFTLPALTSFPQRSSVLLRARDAGRPQAVQVLQALMLRFLTTLPPGKVRFTIIDPVGLGENFAAFMHLADYDDALVGSRIWTEPDHIEQRLADMAGHMENVIQKYLRNQYRSIEEYNAEAGEVAEPFRVLVVANFPTNFTSETAKRLLSIASSGVSCGVFVLVSADTRQAMPDGFNLADLEQSCVTLAWKEPRFLWKDDDFGKFPLTIEAPPKPEEFNRLVHVVGAKAKDANRVEVSFDFIAPKPEDYWKLTSRTGIDVPLGRAGATKRQHLKLGLGTAQHVLIAGKTGSGKSTLLHALITNLALCFGPEEVELYLVDFKKGVEFKTYANYELPHARVVAVESEREFGLSVLQRLDTELRSRGERYRKAGANDVKTFRDATGQVLPRILLIVDEFQEFFVEDDKLAQEAALLLDRLVRQGRAFGLHILLGSQTLGGAYTLARSTIDQMAVRIALQCSEADANLILSKDNSAARLLSRPGEAIYNDQNGLLEGNDIFQVVWLPDARREELLGRIRAKAVQRGWKPPRPQLVFEGNAPADVHKNHLLMAALNAPEWTAQQATTAWLGEAIAIKDPSAAVFRRQTSSNLLLLGQHDEAALGILATALAGIAAQQGAARFFVLDGSPTDWAYHGLLGRSAEVLPQETRVGSWRELKPQLTEIAEEVDRRQKTHEGEYPPWYLVLYGLQRFRDLRKADDDFGYSRREATANPADQLGTIIKEGPAVGIHVLLWCDSLNNLNRAFDRGTLREFEMRVLFQMSPNDSSTLIDSPAASKLGMHRALYHNEDLAQPEKFRPYSLPTAEWLAEVKAALGKKRVVEKAGV